MLTLTAQDLIENARKAYLDGKLIAQLPQDELEASQQKMQIFQLWQTTNIDCVCAVGASIPKHIRENVNVTVVGLQSGPLSHLVSYEDDAVGVYGKLIRLHDAWMSARLGLSKHPGPQLAETLFKAYVGVA